jgi:cytochrome c biogenesis protein CcmG/thiol:disulfide interchange protein DsbE
MKSERILHATLLLSIGVFCLALYSSLHENIVNAGDSAPDFSITTDTGKTMSKSDFGGKLLLLNFWATWCPPCIEEIPGLNDMAQALGPKGLVILGVSVDKDADIYKKFLQRNPLLYPTARDPEQKINLRYGTIQYPESYLIDRNGKVIEKYISSQPWNSPQMMQHIQSLL